MPRGKIEKRFFIVAVLAICLIVCCAAISFVSQTDDNICVVSNYTPPKISMLWHYGAGDVNWLAFSPNGRYFCTVSDNNIVSAYTSSGTQLYSAQIPEATRAIVTDDGRYAMAYSRLDHGNSFLTFLDADGEIHWEIDVEDSVWSVDACSTSDGARFVIGTGDSYLYLIDIGKNRKKFRRWRAPGVVTSISISPDGKEIRYATWQKSAIVKSDFRGEKTWQESAESANLQYIEPLDVNALMLVRSIPNRPDKDSEIMLLNQDGDIIQRKMISAAENARVLSSPNGGYLCLGVDKLIRHKGKSLHEKHAVLLDAAGRTICDKGSLFVQANPLLVTSGGFVLLSTGKNELFLMSPKGELRSVLKTSAPVMNCVASRNGSRALLHCSDGNLYMIKTTKYDTATALN